MWMLPVGEEAAAGQAVVPGGNDLSSWISIPKDTPRCISPQRQKYIEYGGKYSIYIGIYR